MIAPRTAAPPVRTAVSAIQLVVATPAGRVDFARASTVEVTRNGGASVRTCSAARLHDGPFQWSSRRSSGARGERRAAGP
jgi:hypothetical protein